MLCVGNGFTSFWTKNTARISRSVVNLESI